MKKWAVILILAVAQFVMVLDSTVMNVSISTVAQDLGTTISGMQAAITLYALTMAALMLTGGKLGDILGRLNAFKIGAVVYGIGSLTTALAPSLGVLLLGWSLVEGLGAVLVVPAIASLAAINYTGKSRVVAFSILGAVTGLAAAAGPLIGGFMTTYLSWRYVFAAETLIMIFVLLSAHKIKDTKTRKPTTLDLPSVLLSASGMGLLVFGVLQSKTWGWISPMAKPSINGYEIAPLGISLVAYLILAGVAVLWWFYTRQEMLEKAGRPALLKVSMLKIPALRGGLSTLMAQYFAIAALFFVIPVYLQTILGHDALETGLKLIPLSIGLVLFSAIGSRMSAKKTARRIVRFGQLSMILGILIILSAISVELKSLLFMVGMFVVGAGFGLLASQIGNITMSAVDKSDTAEVGGLQGTFQNLGSSFGTALVGSVFMMSLATGFTQTIQSNPSLSNEAKQQIVGQADEGIEIVSEQQAKNYVLKQGGSQQTANTVGQIYEDSQLAALRQGLFFVFIMGLASLALSRNLPNKLPTKP